MEYSNKKIKKIIYFFIAIFVISLVATIICLLILKYHVEGENNMPFELTQMIVVSTAEKIERDDGAFDIVQDNDIYFHIGKNKSYKETEIIKNITVDNFKINSEPKNGHLVIYRPSTVEGEIFKNLKEYLVDDAIVYNGEESTDIGNLSIANQGGIIAFRYVNEDLRKL